MELVHLSYESLIFTVNICFIYISSWFHCVWHSQSTDYNVNSKVNKRHIHLRSSRFHVYWWILSRQWLLIIISECVIQLCEDIRTNISTDQCQRVSCFKIRSDKSQNEQVIPTNYSNKKRAWNNSPDKVTLFFWISNFFLASTFQLLTWILCIVRQMCLRKLFTFRDVWALD